MAEAGHSVTCTDSDAKRIAGLKAGVVPIYEAHLDTLLTENQRSGRLSFTSSYKEAVRAGEVIFVCADTLSLEHGETDDSAMDNVARLMASEEMYARLVVDKNAMDGEAGQQVRRVLEEHSRDGGTRLRVAFNPEFLREGTAVQDFLHPDRIVVGVEEESSEKQLREVYRPILERRFRCPVHGDKCQAKQPAEFLVTTIKSAEIIKHASNSFLALKISYANMIADLCEKVGADVKEVTHAMGLDPRIGPHFLDAGVGFGGGCLPKDVQAFIKMGELSGVDFALLKEVERINKRRIEVLLEKIRRALWVVKGKRVGILGLAFKANTDDIRLAPSLEIIRSLLNEGARVRAYDQEAMDKIAEIYPQIECTREAYDVARGADALVILTAWEEFGRLDWERMHGLMTWPLVIDGRNLLERKKMRERGFEYYGLGQSVEEVEARNTPSPAVQV